jgi:ribosome-associated protein
LPDDVRRRLLRLAGNRLTDEGVLVIVARRYRTQAQNRADARAQLIELLRKAALPPKPRRKTSPTAASKAERLQRKQRRSAVKRSRQAVDKHNDD